MSLLGRAAGALSIAPSLSYANRSLRTLPCREVCRNEQVGSGGPTSLYSYGLLVGERMTSAEILGCLFHGDEADALVTAPVLDEALQHQQHLRAAGHVRVQGYREGRVVHLAADPVELGPPQLLDVAWADETMAVRGLLDEHHRR